VQSLSVPFDVSFLVLFLRFSFDDYGATSAPLIKYCHYSSWHDIHILRTRVGRIRAIMPNNCYLSLLLIIIVNPPLILFGDGASGVALIAVASSATPVVLAYVVGFRNICRLSLLVGDVLDALFLFNFSIGPPILLLQDHLGQRENKS
jgi:hypothetical protein